MRRRNKSVLDEKVEQSIDQVELNQSMEIVPCRRVGIIGGAQLTEFRRINPHHEIGDHEVMLCRNSFDPTDETIGATP